MRHVVTLFVAISCITSQTAASQTRSGGPAPLSRLSVLAQC